MVQHIIVDGQLVGGIVDVWTPEHLTAEQEKYVHDKMPRTKINSIGMTTANSTHAVPKLSALAFPICLDSSHRWFLQASSVCDIERCSP